MKLSVQDRRFAETMAAGGVALTEIADALGLPVAELVEQCDGLEQKAARANARVIAAAYELATSGKAPSVTMFWLRCRLGWAESHKVVNTVEYADREERDDTNVVFHMPGEGEIEVPAGKTKGNGHG